jgi:hypothetical protein
MPSAIFKHWVHSWEEDTEDVAVYRPSDYQFPLSRGRDGFEIKKNGDLSMAFQLSMFQRQLRDISGQKDKIR